jgi:hypothetical protein
MARLYSVTWWSLIIAMETISLLTRVWRCTILERYKDSGPES